MATDYTTLITSQHKDKPLFNAWVALLTGAVDDITDVVLHLPTDFSVDAAVGVQLDAVGAWVGLSRTQEYSIADQYFSFNISGLGWNEADWRGPYEPLTATTVLSDAAYRPLIKAKIESNYYTGTIEGYYNIGHGELAALSISATLLDNQDMTVTAWITGSPTPVQLDLIKSGKIPPKPVGVRLKNYIMSTAPSLAIGIYPSTVYAKPPLSFGSY